jgi:galactose mutarotase-like enzyme
MAKKTWTLVDQQQDLYVNQIALGPEQVDGTATGYSVVKRTLKAGLSQGVDVIEVRSGEFRFTVLPTRGMGIWRASLAGVQLGWKSPVKGPVHPAFVDLSDPSGLGWLHGFDEFIVRCGLESNGAPEFHPDGRLRYGLHGRIANRPAHKVEVTIDGDSGEITLTGTVDETRMFGSKLQLVSTIAARVGQPGITITDTVTNLSAEPSEFELLYHVNFGMPLVGPGAKAMVPFEKLAPRDAAAIANLASWNTYGPEAPGLPEVVFFFDLAADAAGRTQALLMNSAGTQGVSLKFNKKQFPCFSLWKNHQAACDGYVTGLEPATNFPNGKSFEKRMGRVVPLSLGESRQFEFELEAYGDAAAVRAAEASVAKFQQGVEPQILAKPVPEWSAE